MKNIVNLKNFIIATRDSGYKNIGSALAELVDNSLEAGSTKIKILLGKTLNSNNENNEILVIDNGKGMNKMELEVALQFGGSTRFNSRIKYGRYGMGLPNSSLSQCKRVEVFTWQKKGKYLFNFLDVDKILKDKIIKIYDSKLIRKIPISVHSNSGTIIIWKNCDNIDFNQLEKLSKQICIQLGRIFRYEIWGGVSLEFNGKKILPFDPTFLRKGVNIVGGSQFGKELMYNIKVPGQIDNVSQVKVRFVELPVLKWANLTNEEKRKNYITKGAGVSILRNEREIDYGWYFMGDKRKENYDDWWRCEIFFSSELDEVFGVTHTKQGIQQTEFMKNILVPDLEQIARTLKNRARLEFIKYKKIHPSIYSKNLLERTGVYLDGLKNHNRKKNKNGINTKNKGFGYEILLVDSKTDNFFEVNECEDKIILVLNRNHLFYDKIFKTVNKEKHISRINFVKILEVLLFAAARSELLFSSKQETKILSKFKKEWSANIKTFIS